MIFALYFLYVSWEYNVKLLFFTVHFCLLLYLSQLSTGHELMQGHQLLWSFNFRHAPVWRLTYTPTPVRSYVCKSAL